MARGMSDAAVELKLFIDNDSQLYHQQFLSIIKNLMTKIGRGTYDHEKAVKLFMYLCENGAKKYHREFGSPGDRWNEMFTVADRKQAATALRDDFEAEAELGNYDNYLPKKYAGKAKGARGKKNPRGRGAPRMKKRDLLRTIDNSPFLEQYFETALWSTTADDTDDESDDRSLRDKGYTNDDFTVEGLVKMIDAAERFRGMPGVEHAITADPELAGHHFWLAREGHGSGFFDGDWGDDGDFLQEAAEKIGEADLYVAGGKIYVSR